jgi:hypothetical protein
MQQRCKHASPKIEGLCFLRGPCKVVIEKNSEPGRSSSGESSFEFRDANLPAYEIGSGGIELIRVFGIGSCRIMARKELSGERRLHMRFEVTVRLKYPLQEYD